MSGVVDGPVLARIVGQSHPRDEPGRGTHLVAVPAGIAHHRQQLLLAGILERRLRRERRLGAAEVADHPVHVAVGAEDERVRAMFADRVRAARHQHRRLADAVAVGVRHAIERGDGRLAGTVARRQEIAPGKQQPLAVGDRVGDHLLGVEHAVAVGVAQAHDRAVLLGDDQFAVAIEREVDDRAGLRGRIDLGDREARRHGQLGAGRRPRPGAAARPAAPDRDAPRPRAARPGRRREGRTPHRRRAAKSGVWACL